MTVEQMRLFIHLCRTLSFTRTAKQSYITQEGLSYQIRRMEKELGYPLFKRNHKQVELTGAGEKWRVTIETILHLYDKTEILVQETLNDHHPVLSICFYGYEHAAMTELLSRFQAVQPEIRYNILTEKDGNLFQMLHELKADILYAGQDLVSDHVSLGFVQIGQICNGFVLNKHHPLASKPNLSWADVSAETMIIPEIMTSDSMKAYNLSFQRILSEQCPGTKVLYASDFSAALVMTELQMGIMPTSFEVHQAGKAIGDHCVQIPRRFSKPTPVGLVYRKDNPKQCVMDFLDFANRQL